MNTHLLELLDELARFGDDNDARHAERQERMLNITPDTGRLLWTLVTSTRARRILEVGTSNGYSTIWLADAARNNGGRVLSLEKDPRKLELARANLERAGLTDSVELLRGVALDQLKALAGPFDLVFLDADRSNYPAYLELVVPKLAPRGLLLADNVISHATELEAYLQRVKSDARLFSVTLPIGKGEELSVRLE